MKELGKPQSDSDVVNKQPKVLLIGYGWVGQQMGKYFTEADYVETEGIIRVQKKHADQKCNELECFCDEIYKEPHHQGRYNLAIISVPTPMNPKTGQCDVSIVEEVIQKYLPVVDIFLVKSTVEIGTCERLEKQYGVPVCMSPEYLGETLGHPLLEPRKDAFQIIGGNKIAREAVARMFMKVLNADAPMLLVDHVEAEIIKYGENYRLMRDTDYWQDISEICQAHHASFVMVREGLVLDPRVIRTHSNVYEDNRGWAGKCLPKDMNALAYKMRAMGKPLVTTEHLIEKNVEVRKAYDKNNKLIPENPSWR